MRNFNPMQLLVSSDEASADLHIMGSIYGGWFKDDSDTDSEDVVKALAALPDSCESVNVHINSMGGDVAQGVAIYNALKASGRHVTTVCEGFACSIASVIFMAGDKRVMRGASLLMIHDAWTYVQGNSDELRKTADDLDTITELSKRAYMERIGDKLTREELDDLMDGETWILPEQAVEYGLATDIDGEEPEDGPEQSAMQALMRKVTEQPKTIAVAQVTPKLDADEIAQAIVGYLKPYLSEPAQEQEPEPAPQPMSFIQRAALMFNNEPHGA